MRGCFGGCGWVLLALSAMALQGCDEEPCLEPPCPRGSFDHDTCRCVPADDELVDAAAATPDTRGIQAAGPATITTFRDFCDAVRDAECDRLEPCCAAGELAFEREVCEREVFGQLPQPLTWCGRSLSPAAFDADAAAECLELRAQSFDGCDFLRADSPIVVDAARVCERVAVFVREPKAPCEDAPCFAPPGMVSQCDVWFDAPGPFFCTEPSPRPSLGEGCAATCAFGLFCDSGQCVAPRLDGASCRQDYECSSNQCMPPGVTDRRCEPVRTIGWMECESLNDPRIPHPGSDAGVTGFTATDGGTCEVPFGEYTPVYSVLAGTCGDRTGENVVPVGDGATIEEFAKIDVETETIVGTCSVQLLQLVRDKAGNTVRRIAGDLEFERDGRLIGEVDITSYDENGIVVCHGTYHAVMTLNPTSLGASP